jgi:acyl dehydratase
MPLPLGTLGSLHSTTAFVDPEQVRAYLAATNDGNPAYASGRLAPPVYGCVPSWDPMIAALHDVMPADRMPMLLHAFQDMRFHRDMVPGTTLKTDAALFGVRAARAGTWVTMRSTSHDVDSGLLVMEQYGTMFIRGWKAPDSSGDDRPDHSFPSAARGEPVAEVTATVDADQTLRYADASGDRNGIHVDDEFARKVGLPGIILHGMCTMAVCAQGVIEGVAGSDPSRLRRLAVRFAKPVLPGSDLVTTVYALGAGDRTGDGAATPGAESFAFEATSRGERVIRDGRAEIG